MIRPNFIDSKTLYLNPGFDAFTTAEIALIDSPNSNNVVNPYAYTAAVREDYDAFNFYASDSGANLAAGQRVAFGLFLTADNLKGNLLFQLYGKARFNLSGTNTAIHGTFIFGRRAVSDVVVSSKAGPNNLLSTFIGVPSMSLVNTGLSTAGLLVDSVETELFSLKLDAGFVYCFAYMMSNYSASPVTLLGGVSLAFRKYQSEIGVFRPAR